MLLRTTSQSLTHQLAARFTARIRDHLLAPGTRLPSVRQCAAQQGVSPSTVVAAYDQLLAQGPPPLSRPPRPPPASHAGRTAP